MPLDKGKLLELVADGEARQAIEEILAHKDQIPKDRYYTIVGLSAELSENEKGEKDRTLSQDVIIVQRNGINKALIAAIHDLDKPATGKEPPQEKKEPSESSTTDSKSKAPSTPTTELEATQSKIEKLVDTIAYVISQLLKRPWKYKLINLVAILLLFLNPIVVGKAFELVSIDKSILEDIHYKRFFWVITGVLFIVAVYLAVRDILKSGDIAIKNIYNQHSPIKGLRHFDFDDAEVFKKLQRHQDIEICLQGVEETDFRFGVLTGESGCGKTSFLRAGLYPAFIANSKACVVAKLRNEAPLQSIREAVSGQIKVQKSPPDDIHLKELLEFYLEEGKLDRLVLIIDQFEQFFTQYKIAEARQPFINQLNECYQELPQVKILVSLRKDYQGYLYEIQDVLGYALVTRSNYFDLKKFTPTQATEIFRVMAEAEGLEFNTSFVYDTCKEELASKDDGLISAVDIQILAFIIKGQQLEEKAFTQAAFQKMGGIEGLLQRYLQEHFEAPNRYNRDQAALKVLLAFIDLDHNVRSGDLSVKQLLEKVNQPLSQDETKAILDWLEGLRLVTKTLSREEETRYELAHERLILPLRNLAGKTLSKMDQANIILDRRTNEWLVNDRKARFLLSWGEYRNIIRHKKLLSWGKTEEAKKDLLNATRRKFQRRLGLIAGLAILGILAWGYNQQNRSINNLFAEADQHIIGLEYDSAAVKLMKAGKKQLKRKKAAQKMLEVVFYYNEIGETERAVGLLQDSVFQLKSNAAASNLLASIDPTQAGIEKEIDNVIKIIGTSYYHTFLIPRYFPEMVTVKGGTYQMGNLKNDLPEDSARVVTLSDFRMAKTETTIWQYQLFAIATDRLELFYRTNEWNEWIGSTPVINVSWYDAIAYANWVSERLGFEQVYQLDTLPEDPNDLVLDTVYWKADGFRLPTEAEWEYAARGGSLQDTFIFAGSNNLDSVGWHDGNVGLVWPFVRTHPVATKAANNLELYDMSGNVLEWCWDWYDGLESIKTQNPKGPNEGVVRVLRGGSWYDNYIDCRVSYRDLSSPDFSHYYNGFRLSQGL